MEYEKKVQEQLAQYENNSLRLFPPQAHRHWMRQHVLPKVSSVFNVADHVDLYLTAIPEKDDHVSILSIGSGDGQLEVAIAERLCQRGSKNFTIHITELSNIRQDRTRARIEQAGFSENFSFHILDFNKEFVDGKYDMAFAHHVLHHIVELEFLFDNILETLNPGGRFATIDMIGRNGHMRWPEALEYAELAWQFIPDHWKHNFQLNSFDEDYVNFDCSKSGFEGIRSEDVHPLLLEKFRFEKFVAVGGFIDVIFDRGYGQSINMDDPKERALVDFLSSTNELLLESGQIKPTMIFAHLVRPDHTSIEGPVYWKNMTPDFALRKPD